MHKKAFLSVVALMGGLLLSGCDVTTPSQIKTGKIELRQGMVTQSIDVRSVDRGVIAALADDYLANGDGPMRMTIAYPAGHMRQQQEIEKKGAAYREAFARKDVKDLRIDFVPVEDIEYAGMAVVSYSALKAHAPSGCGRIPGYDGSETLEQVDDYDMGCETRRALSQMISNPKDLLGVPGSGTTTARRQGAVVETYQDGTPNDKFIENMFASDIGQ